MAKRKIADLLKQDKNMKPKAEKKDPLGVPRGAVKLHSLPSHIKAKLGRTDDMSELELCLANDSKFPTIVEITGTVLHPSDNSHQRLFVAGNHEIPMPMVTIPAGKKTKVRLATCCMDKHRASPASRVEYRITSAEPREQDVQAARNWMTARKFLDGTLRLSDVDTKRYALQHDFAGARSEVKPTMSPEEARKKAELSYVQGVCWDQSSV